MKKPRWIAALLILSTAFSLFSRPLDAEEPETVIHLKDGTVVRGTIVGPEAADPVTVRTDDGIIIEIHVSEIEEIEDEETGEKTIQSERKDHGKILMVAGAIMVGLGFAFRTEPELGGRGVLDFPNILLVGGALLGTSGLILYLTPGRGGEDRP